MLRVNEEVFNFEFTGATGTSANRFCDLGLLSIHPQTQHPSTAVNTFTAIVDLSRSNISIARAPLFQLKSAT